MNKILYECTLPEPFDLFDSLWHCMGEAVTWGAKDHFCPYFQRKHTKKKVRKCIVGIWLLIWRQTARIRKSQINQIGNFGRKNIPLGDSL